MLEKGEILRLLVSSDPFFTVKNARKMLENENFAMENSIVQFQVIKGWKLCNECTEKQIILWLNSRVDYQRRQFLAIKKIKLSKFTTTFFCNVRKLCSPKSSSSSCHPPSDLKWLHQYKIWLQLELVAELCQKLWSKIKVKKIKNLKSNQIDPSLTPPHLMPPLH